MMDPDQSVRIGVALYDGVEPIDLGGTLGVISMASRLLPGLSAVTIADASTFACVMIIRSKGSR